MAYSFQGTSLSGNSTTYDCLSISVSENGTEIDITTAADTYKKFENGFIEAELNFDILGAAPPSINTGGTWTVGFADGTNVAVPGIVMSRQMSGSVGDAIKSSVTIRPTGAIS